jgi:micrococcal nuclease|tara:strand:+ start:160 stop:579 length:420 start_codon:yes stop_codon:yes gene_type:complete
MYEYKCEVKRIVDGDTVDVVIDLGFSILYSTRVRLYGIDTPESRTRNKDEKVRGFLSKYYLKDWLEKGDVVIRTHKDKKGKFGRVLGEMVVDGKNINLLMVDENHAVKYEGQSKDDIKKEHLVNREKLIQKGLFNPDEV